jgi:peptidoglycan L-alanyl-D-glutamate endopeptidase CwlK
MTITLGTRSLARLEGVHPDLVRIVKTAASISDLDFTVLEGLRTVERQKELVKQGASKTMKSRHLTGHAVDLAPMINGKISWDWPLYHRLAKTVKAAAAVERLPLQWGGDWRFKDGPHWELPWKFYPKGN